MTLTSIGRQTHHCDHCGKWAYTTRKDARRAIRRHHPSERGMAAYPCHTGDGWHIGHSLRRERKWPR